MMVYEITRGTNDAGQSEIIVLVFFFFFWV